MFENNATDQNQIYTKELTCNVNNSQLVCSAMLIEPSNKQIQKSVYTQCPCINSIDAKYDGNLPWCDSITKCN